MAAVVPYVGEVLMLRYIVNNATPDNLRLHLYSNNVVPSKSDVLGTYSEVAVGGYSNVSLTGSLWTAATVSGTTTAVYPTQSFTFSTSVVVYGLYVTNNASGQLLWAERFDPLPFSIPTSGGQIQIDPVSAFGCS